MYSLFVFIGLGTWKNPLRAFENQGFGGGKGATHESADNHVPHLFSVKGEQYLDHCCVSETV
jgi:hypothetical protein